MGRFAISIKAESAIQEKVFRLAGLYEVRRILYKNPLFEGEINRRTPRRKWVLTHVSMGVRTVPTAACGNERNRKEFCVVMSLRVIEIDRATDFLNEDQLFADSRYVELRRI